MQFEALKVFCDIARLRSFSKAAQLNEITQSAASQIVHTLEARLGAPLIDRSRRPLNLTPVGKAYYQGCKRLVEEYLELEAQLRDDRTTLSAVVRVAAIYSVGLGDIGQYRERFRQMQPHVEVHLNYLHPSEVYQRVHEGAADFGLVSFPRKGRDLLVLPWCEENMVLACAPRHPLAQRGKIALPDLAEYDYIAFRDDLPIRHHVDRFLRGQGVSPHVAAEFDNIESIKRAVEDNGGVALLPEPSFLREVAAGTLVARSLQGVRFLRPVGIVYRKHHHLSHFARQFMELLREHSPASFSDFGTRRRPAAAGAPATPPTPSRRKS